MADNGETEYCGCSNCYHRHNGRDGISYCVFDEQDHVLIENIWLRGEDACDAFLSFSEGMDDAAANNRIKKEKKMTTIDTITVKGMPTMISGLSIDHQVCIVDDRDGLSEPYNDIIKKIEIKRLGDKVYAIYTTKEYAISFVYDDDEMKFYKYKESHGMHFIDRAYKEFKVFLTREEADAYFNPMSILGRCVQKATSRSSMIKGRLRILMDEIFFKRHFRHGCNEHTYYEKAFNGIEIIPIDNLECNFIVVKDVSCHWK